jgi:2-(3-amino-3-carboxypropyl)histidine synthase
MRTLFIEAYIKADIEPLLNKVLKIVPEKKIGLVTTVQHIKNLKKAQIYLKKGGKDVYVGTPAKNLQPKQGIYAFHSGQLLGCDASAALDIEEEVDAFVFLGTGEFHPLFIAFNSEKPIWLANPLTQTVKLLPEERRRKFFAKQAARMHHAEEAKCYGIIVSTKPGQVYLNMAKRMKEQAEKLGKKAIILLSDTITPNDLMNYHEVDCFVNTACPRIVEDQPFYPKTMINGTELRQIFDKINGKTKAKSL